MLIALITLSVPSPAQAAWFGLFDGHTEEKTLVAQVGVRDTYFAGSDSAITHPKPSLAVTSTPIMQDNTLMATTSLTDKHPTSPPPPSWVLCSCVNFVKWISRRQNESWGNARAMKPTSQIPRAGKLVLTSEGGGHVAYVVSVASSSITVSEANYRQCKQTERVIPLDSPFIRGYLDKN